MATPTTSIVAASNDAALPQLATLISDITFPASTITVDATAGFATAGFFTVQSSLGRQTIAYAGITATTFTGCSGGSGSAVRGTQVTQTTAINGGFTFPAPGGIINVASTAGFPANGTFTVESTSGLQAVTFSSRTGTSFGGCVGGVGTVPNGAAVISTSITVASTASFRRRGALKVQTSNGFQVVNYRETTPTTFTGCAGGSGLLSSAAGRNLVASLPTYPLPLEAVANIEELRPVAPWNGATGLQQVEVLGFRAPGDGGEGVFVWTPVVPSGAYSLDDNVGIVITSTTGAVGRWRRAGWENLTNSAGTSYETLPSALNVKWFGAKADGISDDSGAIQATLDAAAAIGANLGAIQAIPPGGYRYFPVLVTVYMPQGQYVVGTTLEQSYGVILKGEGNVYISPTPTTMSSLVILRIAAFTHVRGITFSGGLTAIAIGGGPLRNGSNFPYFLNNYYGAPPMNFVECSFFFQYGPSIWHDGGPATAVAATSNGVQLIQWEIPRLCRGGSRSLTNPGVHP